MALEPEFVPFQGIVEEGIVQPDLPEPPAGSGGTGSMLPPDSSMAGAMSPPSGDPPLVDPGSGGTSSVSPPASSESSGCTLDPQRQQSGSARAWVLLLGWTLFVRRRRLRTNSR
jgi:hypothetical protein